MKTITLDIDGVVADFTGGVREELRARTGVDIFDGRLSTDGYPLQWECFDHLSAGQRMMLEEIMKTYDFWNSLHYHYDGMKLMRLADDKVYKLFVTNRPKLPSVILATDDWMHDLSSTRMRILFAHNKGLVAKALQVDAHLDDNYQVAYDIVTHSSARSYLLKRPYNTVADPHPHIRYVASVDEFIAAEGLE